MGVVFIPLVLICGEIVGAMDGMLLAESYRLGVKKSTIRLPWEHSSMSAVFGKKPRLISPPVFFPMPSLQKSDETLAQSEMSGKVTWSKVTSVIPWPVAQERAFGRALENWRIIVMDNLEASVLGTSDQQYSGWPCTRFFS